MQTLIEGFRQFRANGFQDHAERFRELAIMGQSPRAAVIACCDSRVDPQLIFSARPGDLFIIRNVANLVPPYHPNADYHGTSAALEFAVRGIGVRHVIVMGHTLCGGVRALLEQNVESDFLGSWMSIADTVRHSHRPETVREGEAEQDVIRLSLANLMTFPWVREKVEAGGLQLHGCLFDVAAADLLLLQGDRFVSVDGDAPRMAAHG
ncbi:MAG TPA: carbonic anhydrase [Azospirillaceae bacterium]|nr:carbonic anhydrase [Azospirillaceae bacterium]